MMICFSEFRSARIAWAAARLALGGLALIPLAGTAAVADDDVQSRRIRIEYAPPKSPEIEPYYQLVMQRKALEKVQELFSPLMLPSEITVRTTECGISNAWYQRPTVSICYEYLRDVIDMAPKAPSRDGITPYDAVLGQFLFTAAHEMGHAVFDLLDVPIFGRPEDAADQFAAYILLRIGKQDARKLIEGAAYMYKDYVGRPTVTVPVTAFADVHGAPMQRFYDLLCIGYGADSEMFAALVDYLPKARVPGCKTEYGEVNFAFQKLIEPHVDQNLKNEVLSKSWVPADNAPPPRLSDLPQAKQGGTSPENVPQSLKSQDAPASSLR
jgi:Putative metallopeptidase